jgi:hypothetical protein
VSNNNKENADTVVCVNCIENKLQFTVDNSTRMIENVVIVNLVPLS